MTVDCVCDIFYRLLFDIIHDLGIVKFNDNFAIFGG